MELDLTHITEMSREFADKFNCSNYEHHNPTTTDVKAFILDVLTKIIK